MNYVRLFRNYITDVWKQAQNNEITWENCNEILTVIYDSQVSLGCDKSILDAIWTLGMVAYERDMMVKQEKTNALIFRYKREALLG